MAYGRGAKAHIHKYKKVPLGKGLVWKCMLAGCKHFLQEALVEGRESLCNKCDQPFTMTREKMTRVKPKCDACQSALGRILKGKESEEVEEVVENLDVEGLRTNFDDFLEKL